MTKAVLYAGLSGLRVSEIRSLNVEQFREGRLWQVEGKGGTVRTIPLTVDAQRSITEYIGNRKRGPLFKGRWDRVTVRTLQNMVYRASEKALGRRINPHVLRHTFCTLAAQADIPIVKIGRLAGHRSPAITELYIHLTADDLEPEVRKLDRK
jgi:integrase/recombinase XerC